MRAVEIRERFAATVKANAIKRLIFAGAHEAEEAQGLYAAGVEHLTLIEPIPHLAAKLRLAFPQAEVIQAACSDHAGTATLHIPARTNMATLVEAEGVPVDVPTVRLDEVCPDAEAAVIDVQGHELAVLSAAPWDSLRLLMVETLHGTVDPTLSPPYDDVVAFMTGKGFAEVACYPRDYDYIQKWAYGRTTTTGAEVRDVVFAKTDSPLPV